jgi:toxin ParE1/3/4
MDRRLVWSPEAADDLESIADYIGRDSPAYARSVAAKILATVRTLPEFPHIGRVVPGIGDPAVRERLTFSYRRIYRVAPDRLLVVAIIHGKRSPDALRDRLGKP